MDLPLWLFSGLVSLTAVVMMVGSIAALLVRRRCPALIDLSHPAPKTWPLLTVVVPACNEAETIEAALSSLLASDYPNLEIIVINDRSEDDTGLILDRLAGLDSRIVPVHVSELREGWLGKIHALDLGLQRSTGKWVLFTDADVHFEPDALRRAIACVERENYAHLALLPGIPMKSFVLGIVIAAAFRSLLMMARLWAVNDPRSPRGMGVGAFNLVHREAFLKSPGLEWLKMEVADDVGLGIMMKRQVGRSQVLVGRGAVSVEWYPTLGAAVRGLEKNGFAQAARFSALRGVVLAALAGSLALLPFVGLLPGWPTVVRLMCLSALLLHVSVSSFISRAFGVAKIHLIFAPPLGDLIMAFIVLRSTWRGIRRGGVVWRGTFYPSAALKAGRRVDL